ncbi:formylglycine-generating enzyme family protein [Chitinophaga tropicalis]|uniref:SUMF1/EgtB/PvdO family nonheme iron enzyme n=1 Tax=Chitinophaga tropicalis TaxID=2683588 RepID=A0A7K1U7E1_9BACT|nr:SUMF1/EgtB/PvdO family nonheme iron enzyme [Chitinophaga tropicalis]MVT10260.1 SUMF1/EgtB/PvdO family nonheme iron enzyme [Chitinophaga tropicalis]
MLTALLSCLLTFGAPPDTVFVRIPVGDYQVGRKGHHLNPLRKVHVNSYYIGATEVTNRLFAAFITATGYVTDAERRHNAMVFEPGLEEFRWLEDSTACWKYPNGISRGGITDKMDHPVTCISYADIQVYCKWAGVRLPSFEEWEIASRAGASTTYFWGEDTSQLSTYANVWHGHDHLRADSTDGYMYTSPVASFKPNAFGLYDVYGNVFEFCEGHLKDEKAVHARGGSWWCSQHSCSYFNSVEIGRVNAHASFSNQGFRVVKKIN